MIIPIVLLTMLSGMTGLVSCGDGADSATDDLATANSSADTVTENCGEDVMYNERKAELEHGAIYRISVLDEEFEKGSLTAENFAMTDNSMLKVKTYTKDLSQMWRAYLNDDGTYSFENMATLMRMSIVNPDKYKKEKTLSVCLDHTNDVAKSWNVYTLDGTLNNCVIENTYTSYCSIVAKTKIEGLWYVRGDEYSGTEAQRWSFKKLSDGQGEYPHMLVLSGDHQGRMLCPEIIYSNGVYYNFNQNKTVAVRTSTDLINWTLLSEYALRPRPEWLAPISGTGDIWAPGVYEMGGRFYMYYCTSSLGKQTSAIGVAVCDDLSLNTWQDLGMVMRSYPGDEYNAIDPNIFIDKDGSAYMLWGSYWSGIYMKRINPETGKFFDGDSEVWHLAKGIDDMEASYLIYRDGYYYLFCARGGLSKGTYYWAVGRSESLYGPYVDKNGKTLLEGGGTRLTEWKEGVAGVGHASYLVAPDGTPYMVADSWEYRNDSGIGTVSLSLSTIVWTEDGWPVTALDQDVLRALGD